MSKADLFLMHVTAGNLALLSDGGSVDAASGDPVAGGPAELPTAATEVAGGLQNLAVYLSSVSKNPLLTATQEIELARKVRAGEREAINSLVASNLRLVISIAKRYVGHGLELEDLIQEGNMGLMQAARKYDPSKGTRFSTYATWWVRQAVQRALSNKSRTVRIPVHINQGLYRLKRAAKPFFQEHGRAPSIHELSAASGLPVEEVVQVCSANLQMCSLDESISGEAEETLERFIEDPRSVLPESTVEETLLAARIDRMLKRLTPLERRVVELRFGIGTRMQPTDAEIASSLHTDCGSVRRATIRAMRKLRKLNSCRKLSDYLS